MVVYKYATKDYVVNKYATQDYAVYKDATKDYGVVGRKGKASASAASLPRKTMLGVSGLSGFPHRIMNKIDSRSTSLPRKTWAEEVCLARLRLVSEVSGFPHRIMNKIGSRSTSLPRKTMAGVWGKRISPQNFK